MSKLNTTTYELDQIAIVQAPVSYTSHRGDVDNKVTICDRNVYPIFVAPMASVTDENNYQVWIDNTITPVIPRSVHLSFNDRMQLAKKTFVSISLKEAEEDFIAWASDGNNFAAYEEKLYICIDIAHGTLNRLYDICKIIKNAWWESVEIMTGNVANPDSYQFYADAGIDWCRVGIGGGSRCTSSANVGIHYGMATLLDKINESRKAYAHSHNGQALTKIIADGGIANFDDINKALALGADAVMCGRLIAQSEEACGEIYNSHPDSFGRPFPDSKRVREYYGMSTKRAQKETGGEGNRTSEGISKPVEVLYPISKWVDNMQSYLRSCMTYTNSRTIKELRENAQVVICDDHQFRK